MGCRNYLVGVLVFVLLIWGPIDHSWPAWLAIRTGYLIAIPLATWFLLAWIWRVWQPDAASEKEGQATFQKDDLYDDAVRIVLETKRGSVSLLQRRMGIGYVRASRLIDMMAESGILGDFKGAGVAREVLLTLEEWEKRNQK